MEQPPGQRKRFIQTQKKKRPYSFYVTLVIGLQHTLLSLCCQQKIGALNVKIQNFQAFRYYPIIIQLELQRENRNKIRIQNEERTEED